MAQAAEEIRQIVEQVLKSSDIAALLGAADGAGAARRRRCRQAAGCSPTWTAPSRQPRWRSASSSPFRWTRRARMIEAMRQAVLTPTSRFAREAVRETGLGNVRDKQIKTALAAREDTRAWRTWSRRHSPTSTA